jgi:hypothetical protein
MGSPLVEATLLYDTDIVARDRDGRVALFVDVTAREAREAPASDAQWVRPATETGPLPPFFMCVDLGNISTYRRDERPVVIEVEEDRSVAFHFTIPILLVEVVFGGMVRERRGAYLPGGMPWRGLSSRRRYSPKSSRPNRPKSSSGGGPGSRRNRSPRR